MMLKFIISSGIIDAINCTVIPNDQRCPALIMILSANRNKFQLFVAPLVAKFIFLQINLIIFGNFLFWCEVYVDVAWAGFFRLM